MFQAFRRRRKTLLAALTLMAMFAFVFLPGIGGGLSSRRDPRDKERNKVVTTIDGHPVTRDNIMSARREMQLANKFVVLSMAAGLNVPPQFVELQYGSFFGSTETDEDIEDAIRMTNKADEYGIKITDDMVRDFIRGITRGRLTTEQYQGIAKGLGRFSQGLNGDTLFEILRRQLRARRVEQLATGHIGGGSTQVTPYEAWQFYRKLHERVTLDVVPVKVSNFTSEIADPGDTVLRLLFDKFASRFPDPNSSEPGFKEPRKVRVQYATVSLEALLLAMRGDIEITEDEMTQYYDSHKYQYLILPTKPDQDDMVEPVQVPEKPKLDEPKKDESATDKDANEPKKEKPDEPKPTDAPKSDDANKKKPDDARPCVISDDTKEKPADAQGESQTPPAKANADADKPQAPPSDDSKSGADKPQSVEKSAKPEHAGEQDTKAPEKPDAESAKMDEPDQSDTKKDEPRYKPFDEVKDEIADKLARQKARDELLQRMKKVQALVNRFADDEYLPLKTESDKKKEKQKDLEFTPPEPPNFTKQVEELGLKFEETKLIRFEDELAKVEGLGEAFELSGDGASRKSVLSVLNGVDLYDPIELVNSQEQFFTAWKVADMPAREPTFAEARDRALAAFRAIEARKPARARAEKLAESLRAVGGNVAKLLENEPEFESHAVPSVPLWSESSVFGRGRVEPSVLPGVENPGDDLRNIVFQMKEGDVEIAPNRPQDTYYVIVVSKREPAVHESFARSRMLVEMQVRDQLNQEQRTRWITDLREQSSGGKIKAPAGN